MAKYVKPLPASEDEEGGGNLVKYRLPFALCKERGIELPKWATPRDAWDALKGYGIDPQKEYERLLERKLQAEERAEKKKKERAAKREQMKNPEHKPDYKYEHKEGYIAGVKRGKPMSDEEADNGHCNPYYAQGLFGYETNCQTCVVAYEARKRGYDVRALPNFRNGYIRDLSRNPLLAYKGGQAWDYTAKTVKEAFGTRANAIEARMKDGERYVIRWAWKSLSSGHIITCWRENNEAVFYDPQNDMKMSKSDFMRFYAGDISNRAGVSMKRVDNLEFNDEYVDYIFKEAQK